MERGLLELCENFIASRDMAKRVFPWGNSYVYPVCASVLTEGEKKVSADDLEGCKRLLKSQAGLFSNFRGIAEAVTTSMLATEENPDEVLSKALEVYGLLKNTFWGSEYLAVAAMIMAKRVDSKDYSFMAGRTRRLYELMKGEHPWLTSHEDSIFAAMLAFSPRSDGEIIGETEECYKILKESFSSRNAVQSLSHVLALCEGSVEEKCRRTTELYKALRERGCKYGTSYELATLGVLANLPISREGVVRSLMETDEFLSGQKGYGIFDPGKKQRLMHAAMIVSSYYTEDSGAMRGTAMSGAAIGGTVSMIAAQQAAMCACMAAAAASSSASSSS